ncbi:MAG TPA: hypothetical protein VFO83_03720, partial [Aggregicoccus sp.]|nr:hypothetical protein [Aggregicoccus sp.]
LLHSRHIVLWGKNPAVSNVHLVPVLQDAKARGAELVLIDPIHHRSASLAHAVLQPAPGRDFELALGVARALFDAGRVDPGAERFCADLPAFLQLVARETVGGWAAQAGVDIDLLVRGICCLRPGVPGVSERIRVSSVVDRFLEHSRVFAFGAGDSAEVYLSSADWMPRNFHSRIEAMSPVEDPLLRARLLDEVLGVSMRDNVKARRLQRDGTYVPVEQVGPPVRSQNVLLELARRTQEQKPIESLLRHAAAPESPSEVLRPAANQNAG